MPTRITHACFMDYIFLFCIVSSLQLEIEIFAGKNIL